MAMLWTDFPSRSRGLYGTTRANLANGAYANDGGITTFLADDPDPNIGSLGVVLGNNSSSASADGLRKVLPAEAQVVGFAFRFWLNSLPSSASIRPAYTLRDFANNDQVSMTIDPVGRIQIRTGSPTGTVVAESDPILTANGWTHIEAKFTAGTGTLGEVEVRVEGVPRIQATGIATSVGGNYGQWMSRNGQETGAGALFWYTKDLVIWNGLGGEDDDFFGTVTVFDLPLNQDISSGWTKIGGSSDYEILDNIPPNDAQYIQAGDAPIPAPSILGFTDLPDDISSIRALQVVIRGRKSDGGDGNIQVSLLSDGDRAEGADRPLTSAFTYWWDIFNTDPATGFAWTPSAVDSATLEINRTL